MLDFKLRIDHALIKLLRAFLIMVKPYVLHSPICVIVSGRRVGISVANGNGTCERIFCDISAWAENASGNYSFIPDNNFIKLLFALHAQKVKRVGVLISEHSWSIDGNIRLITPVKAAFPENLRFDMYLLEKTLRTLTRFHRNGTLQVKGTHAWKFSNYKKPIARIVQGTWKEDVVIPSQVVSLQKLLGGNLYGHTSDGKWSFGCGSIRIDYAELPIRRINKRLHPLRKQPCALITLPLQEALSFSRQMPDHNNMGQALIQAEAGKVVLSAAEAYMPDFNHVVCSTETRGRYHGADVTIAVSLHHLSCAIKACSGRLLVLADAGDHLLVQNANAVLFIPKRELPAESEGKAA